MSWRFNPPPGWPVPSGEGWLPPAGWAPDPQWPQPPPGWEFWVHTASPPVTTDTRTRCRPAPRRGRPVPVRVTRARTRWAVPPRGQDPPGPVARLAAAVVIAVLTVLALAVSAGLHFDLPW